MFPYIRRSTKELIKLAGYLALVLYCNGLATVFANQSYWTTKSEPNFDLIHSMIQYDRRFEPISNLALIAFNFAAGVVVVMVQHRPSIRRLLEQLIVVFAGRAVSILVTFSSPSYPDAADRCLDPITDPIDYWIRPFALVIEIITTSSDRILCCDNIWSGHTSAMLVFGNFIFEAVPPRYKANAMWTMSIVFLSGVFGLLAARLHYSVDVFVAIVASIAGVLLVEKYDPIVEGDDEDDE